MSGIEPRKDYNPDVNRAVLSLFGIDEVPALLAKSMNGYTFITGDIGTDLVTTAGSAEVTSAGSTFVTDGLQAGDTLVIGTGADAGVYTVVSVDSETQLTLDRELVATDITGTIPFDTSTYLGDTADQVLLYDDGGTLVDYVAWSSTTTTTADFKADDQPAVLADIWSDNAFRDVSDVINDYAEPIAVGEAMYRIVDGADSDVPADWEYQPPSIDAAFVLTLAVVSGFRAVDDNGRVVIEWTTASEVGTIGFHLQRFDPVQQQWVRVSAALRGSGPRALAPFLPRA